jgi:hypothetical protein
MFPYYGINFLHYYKTYLTNGVSLPVASSFYGAATVKEKLGDDAAWAWARRPL